MADLAAIKNNVRNMLIAEFGNASENENGNFYIRHNSAMAFISIGDWQHGDENVGVVSVFSIVVAGLKEINKDLAVELTTNLSRFFSTWFFFQRDDGLYNLILKSDMIGATLDQPELATAVYMVALAADELDDQIVAKYGGSVYVTD